MVEIQAEQLVEILIIKGEFSSWAIMSDSENESSSESLHHDRMSVSDQEGDVSRDEDDMPSIEVDFSEGIENTGVDRDQDSIATDSTSSEDLPPSLNDIEPNEVPGLLASNAPTEDLDKATVSKTAIPS